MRAIIIAAAAFAGIAILPNLAVAQDPAAGAVGGAATGAIAGGLIGGPPGAAVGAAVGGTVGAASQSQPPREREVIIEKDRAPTTTQTCVHQPGRTDCVEERR
jgi:outer membrane lipoprotein SlyB